MGASTKECPETKRHRRLLQFSLRSLLALTTVAAVLLGWYAYHARRAQRQQAAVEAIQFLGGGVLYEHEDGPTDMSVPRSAPGPKWGREWLGVDFFRHVKIVSLNEAGRPADGKKPPTMEEIVQEKIGVAGLTKQQQEMLASMIRARPENWINVQRLQITDKDLGPVLADLAVLPRLKTLKLWNSSAVTFEACPELTGLTQLETLNVHGTSVTDLGASRLASLVSLRELDISRTKISDTAMRSIGRLDNLETLYLSGNPITDEGIAQLRSLRRLRTLSLDLTNISDTAIENLSGHLMLERLNLAHTSVTDDCLSSLRSLGRLTQLKLTDTRVTRSAVDKLGAFKNLEHLDVRQTAITADDVQFLKAKLPDTNIDF